MRLSLASVSAEQVLFGLSTVTVASVLIFGGGARVGYLSDSIVQIFALPLLLVAIWRLPDLSLRRQAWWALIFCAAVIALPLLQLIPLPPAVWTALPNREAVVTDFHLLGRPLGWMPISVSPHRTWLSALSLLVPLAIFIGTLQLDYRRRRSLSLLLLAVGVLSVFLGLVQVSQGSSSGLRLSKLVNPSDAVGLFANRNHFAALIYSLILLAAAWATHTARGLGSGPGLRKYETSSILALVASFTILVVLVAAQAMAHSRAGLALTIVALMGALALAFADRRSAPGVTPMRLLLAATAVAMIFATQFALYRIMERFAVDPLQDARIPIARTTFEAAKAFMPLGAGMGSFVPVYASFERPEDLHPNFFANRAHNDPLELWLEAGLPGLALMAIFAVWLVVASWSFWRRSPSGTREIDQALARAATLIIGLLITHSLVDYALRTAAMMAVMAFACALLIEPPAVLGAPGEHQDTGEKGAQYAPPSGARTPAWSEPAVEQPSAGARWGEDIEWPAEWRGGPRNPRRPRDGPRGV